MDATRPKEVPVPEPDLKPEQMMARARTLRRMVSARPNRCSPRSRFSNTSITTGSAFSVWPCR